MESYESLFGYRPDLTFTLEQHLKNFAECEENARRLLESFHIIREKMEVNLRPVIALFPHYSEHSHEHSEHIIAAVEKLLGTKRIEKLSPADTWMLLVSAYTHDLGMLVQGKELETDWDTPEFQNYLRGCAVSSDEGIKRAADTVLNADRTGREPGWPVTVYRDVILLVSEFYRRRHPERARMLPDRAELKQSLHVVMSIDGKIPPRIQDVLGKICSAHGLSFEELLALLEPTDSLLGYVFHPRFIAAMLCLGDLCDLDNGRFNEMALEVFGGVTKKNLVHYYKHESVISFVMQKDMISVIFDISSRKIRQELKQKKYAFENPTEPELQDFCDAVLLETQNWLGWMEDIVRNIKLHWDKFAYPEMEAFFPSLQYKILVDGQETLSSRKNLRFSFSNEKAYELIESYSLYNNRLIFIRELLQNSMDALKRQFWADIRSGRWNHLLKHLEKDGSIPYREIQPFDFSDPSVFDQYQVRIEVTHQEGQPFAIFAITDNGTGISREDVENRILRTGFHQENTAAEEEMPEWLRPTSAFGIGLHSVFAVTDTIFVQTKTETDPLVYNLNMHSGKRDGYVFMSIADRQDLRFCNCMRGTRIQFSVGVEGWRDALESWEKECGYYGEDLILPSTESYFCRFLEEMVTRGFQGSLFAVNIQFNNEYYIFYNTFYESQYWKPLCNKERRNHIFNEIITDSNYDFALDIAGNFLVVWNRQRAILTVYYLDSQKNKDCRIYCKGFRVKDTKIPRRQFDLMPDILDFGGGDTRDILSVSRDQLSQKQTRENKELFRKTGDFVAKIYAILLKQILTDKMVKEWHEDMEEFMNPWLQDKVQDSALPELSGRLDAFVKKYSCFLLEPIEIMELILWKGVCMLLGAWEERIPGVLPYTLVSGEALEIDIREIWSYEPVTDEDLEDEERIIKESTYIWEFMVEVFKICMDADKQDHLYKLRKFLIKELPSSIKKDFNVYDDTMTGFAGGEYKRDREYFGMWKPMEFKSEYPEKELAGYCTKPFDIYMHVPFTEILYKIICTQVDISSMKEFILSELSCLPHYDMNFGFLEVNHVGDIVMSDRLKIQAKNAMGSLLRRFPFLKWTFCESISIDEEGEFVLELVKRQKKSKLVEYKGCSFKKFIFSLGLTDKLPAPVGFEAIAVEGLKPYLEIDNGKKVSINNYKTYLWDHFCNIYHRYHPRIASGESKESIADEIMSCSGNDHESLLYVLHHIYHYRAFHKDLPFEEAWQNICDTYRRFILMVLDCIPTTLPEEDSDR